MVKVSGWVLSPTRMIFDVWKKNAKNQGEFHRSWSRFFIFSELALSAFLIFLTAYWPSLLDSLVIAHVFIFLAWSRINELIYAFYQDAISHLKSEQQASDLKFYERLQMALKSYIGLITYFAIFYYFIRLDSSFEPKFNNFFESMYFSVITITTLGYGDFLPKHWLMKVFSMYEVLTGLLMVVVVIGAYVGAEREDS
jgi:voltage-gated potassium channel Kch